MTDKEQDVPCAICCGNLSLSMTKEEMQGLLETLIERNLVVQSINTLSIMQP